MKKTLRTPVAVVLVVAVVLGLSGLYVRERMINARWEKTWNASLNETAAYSSQVGELEKEIAHLEKELALATNMYRRYEEEGRQLSSEKMLMQWYIADFIQETAQAMSNRVLTLGVPLEELVVALGGSMDTIGETPAFHRLGLDYYYDSGKNCYYGVSPEDLLRHIYGYTEQFDTAFGSGDFERTFNEVRYILGDSPNDRGHLGINIPPNGWSVNLPWVADKENELFYYEKAFQQGPYWRMSAPLSSILHSFEHETHQSFVMRLYSDRIGFADGTSWFELTVPEEDWVFFTGTMLVQGATD